jgi:2-oxoglutarate ferredoxin oxidoreductase subunit alpha
VLAPASVQETVEMVMQAFSLAEKYRNPVMILGDGLIGQMMEPVEFRMNIKSSPAYRTPGPPTVWRPATAAPATWSKPLPGSGGLNNHNLLLKSKYDRMKREDVRFETYNTDSDYQALIVSYGTMSRVS